VKTEARRKLHGFLLLLLLHVMLHLDPVARPRKLSYSWSFLGFVVQLT
jgi:hypothetical protein